MVAIRFLRLIALHGGIVICLALWVMPRAAPPDLNATNVLSVSSGVQPPVAWREFRSQDGSQFWYEQIEYGSERGAHIAMDGCIDSATSVVEKFSMSDPSGQRREEYALVIFKRGQADVHTAMWTDGSRLAFVEGPSWWQVRALAQTVQGPTDRLFTRPPTVP